MDRRVLVAEDDQGTALLLQRSLEKAGYTVVQVTDGKSAYERLKEETFQALITDWMMPELDGIELVRLVRQLGTSMYVALISSLNIPAARQHAIGSGANEFFAKPLMTAQLLKSLGAWFDAASKPAAGVNAPPAGGEPRPAVGAQASSDEASKHPIACAATWNEMATSVRKVLSETVGVAFGELAPWGPGREGDVRVEISLVDSEHFIDMSLSVEMSKDTAAEIGRQMMGDVDASDVSALNDIVGELANITGGSLKTAFGKENFRFTLGLAKPKKSGGVGPALAVHIGARAPEIDLVVRCVVGAYESSSVQATQLREGMVLTENVCSATGSMLLPAGTRLTASAADRLGSVLKNRMVKVVIPD